MNAEAHLDRRAGLRVRTDLPLTSYRDGRPSACRAVELSPGGALLCHRSEARPPLVQRLELDLGDRRIAALARTVWSQGQLCGVRFVGLGEIDRLELAEQLDRQQRAWQRPDRRR